MCAVRGDIRPAGSVAKMRCTIALFSSSPVTMGVAPLCRGFIAFARLSKRKFAMRELVGPVAAEARVGQDGPMSRLKLTGSGAAAHAMVEEGNSRAANLAPY